MPVNQQQQQQQHNLIAQTFTNNSKLKTKQTFENCDESVQREFKQKREEEDKEKDV